MENPITSTGDVDLFGDFGRSGSRRACIGHTYSILKTLTGSSGSHPCSGGTIWLQIGIPLRRKNPVCQPVMLLGRKFHWKQRGQDPDGDRTGGDPQESGLIYTFRCRRK